MNDAFTNEMNNIVWLTEGTLDLVEPDEPQEAFAKALLALLVSKLGAERVEALLASVVEAVVKPEAN